MDYHFLTILLWIQSISQRHETMKFQFYPKYLCPDQSIFWRMTFGTRYTAFDSRRLARLHLNGNEEERG